MTNNKNEMTLSQQLQTMSEDEININMMNDENFALSCIEERLKRKNTNATDVEATENESIFSRPATKNIIVAVCGCITGGIIGAIIGKFLK